MLRLLVIPFLPCIALVATRVSIIDSGQAGGASILKLATEEERLSHDKKLSEDQRIEHKAKYQREVRRAFEALLSESKSGNIDSMWRLGCASGVFQKEGFTKEHECIPWLKRAAELGQDEAPFELALKLIRIGNVSEKTDGFNWLKRSTAIGCRRWEAAVELARYYTYGFPDIQLKRSPGTACSWIDKGAKLMGCSKGEFMAMNGLADPQNIQKSLILYE